MASKEKRQRIEQLLQDFERVTANLHADMAGRTAAQILYDDAVVTFLWEAGQSRRPFSGPINSTRAKHFN